MTAAPSMGIELAVRSFSAGGLSFEPADRFNPGRIADLTEQNLVFIRKQRYVAPLTRELYEACLTLRQPGTIGAGFTRKFLIANDIIDDVPAPPAVVFVIDASTDVVLSGGIIRRERSGGAFPLYDVYAPSGEKLNGKPFRALPKLNAFVAELIASTDSASSATAAEDAGEMADDLHVQSESDGHHLEGASAAG